MQPTEVRSTIHLIARATVARYGETNVVVEPNDSEIELDVSLRGWRDRSGNVDDVHAEYGGEKIDLSPDDEARAREILQDATVIDDEPDMAALSVLGWRIG